MKRNDTVLKTESIKTDFVTLALTYPNSYLAGNGALMKERTTHWCSH